MLSFLFLRLHDTSSKQITRLGRAPMLARGECAFLARKWEKGRLEEKRGGRFIGEPRHRAAAGNRVRVRAEIGVVLRIAPPQAASPQPSQTQGGDFGPQRTRTRFPAAAEFVEPPGILPRETSRWMISIAEDAENSFLPLRSPCPLLFKIPPNFILSNPVQSSRSLKPDHRLACRGCAGLSAAG